MAEKNWRSLMVQDSVKIRLSNMKEDLGELSFGSLVDNLIENYNASHGTRY